MTYKLTRDDTIIRLADGASIPPDPENADYRAYLAWLEEPGNEPAPADPLPEAEPNRDERLLEAVEQAKQTTDQAVAGGVFTAQQGAILKGIFGGLGAAITGGT